jgi:hypothetical protein
MEGLLSAVHFCSTLCPSRAVALALLCSTQHTHTHTHTHIQMVPQMMADAAESYGGGVLTALTLDEFDLGEVCAAMASGGCVTRAWRGVCRAVVPLRAAMSSQPHKRHVLRASRARTQCTRTMHTQCARAHTHTHTHTHTLHRSPRALMASRCMSRAGTSSC